MRRQPVRSIKGVVVATLATVLFAAVTVALPGAALAQGASASIGSYTIKDVDGSVTASLAVDTGGADLQAVGVTVSYDAALVRVDSCTSTEELFACNTDEPGLITIESVNPASWMQGFDLATIAFTGLGAEGTAALAVTVDEAYDAELAEVPVEGVDGSITVASRAPSATFAKDCLNGDGLFTFALENPMDDPVVFTMQTAGVDPVTATLEPGTNGTETLAGIEDGSATIQVLADGATILESMESVTCDPEIDPAVTCGDGSATIVVDVTNYTDGFATYRVTIGSDGAQQRSISSGLGTQIEGTVNTDGPVLIVAERNGDEVFNESITVDCGLAVAPTPIPPTPVPPPPTPDPGDGGPGANPGIVEVGGSSTCLAGNGRVDTNIVNTGAADAVYRIEFQGLSPRQTTVAAGDWWRMPITGRPDGDYSLVVKRDGVVVADRVITVACDSQPPAITTPEVQVVNACRAGNGYILFQFANDSDARQSYIIEFEGVQNRSTSADAFGGAVRAVTGRPDGEYSVHIRNGVVPLTNLTVTVDC